MPRPRRTGLLVILLACLAALCPASSSSASATVARRYSVGGLRLYLACSGGGRPTVVLDAGLGGDSSEWSRVQPAVAARTRVCAWDRPGRGRSDPLPADEDETTGLIVNELHGLLHAAGLSPPYVLVGHSIAGLDVRLYQRRFPDEVDALVLVESASENPFVAGDPVDQSGGERMQLRAGARELASSSHWLGSLPLAVIERGRGLDPEWRASQAALSELSGNVLFSLATRSDHGVPFEQPQLVVAATEGVVASARMRAHLPHCSTAVRAAGGSCLWPGTLVSEAPTIELTSWQLALLASVSLILGGLAGAGVGRLVKAARRGSGTLSRLRPRRHPTL